MDRGLGHREGSRFKPDVPPGFDRARLSCPLEFPSHHHGNKLGFIGLFRFNRSDVPSIAEHGSPVTQLENLFQPVCHIDNGKPFAIKFFEKLEQDFRFMVCNGSGRLIENKDPGGEGDRPGDLDKLDLRRTQVRESFSRRDRKGERRQYVPGSCVQMTEIDDTKPRRFFVPEKNVFRHRHVRHKIRLLVDRADPLSLRIQRRVECLRSARQKNRPRIPAQHAGKNAHEGRLAGPVLAHDGMDLPLHHAEADIIKSNRSAEAFGD